MVIQCQKITNLDTDHTLFTKNNSKLIIDLNINVKLQNLEDNIGENLHDLGYGNDFVDTTPRA